LRQTSYPAVPLNSVCKDKGLEAAANVLVLLSVRARSDLSLAVVDMTVTNKNDTGGTLMKRNSP
jgi:hypothetical protein